MPLPEKETLHWLLRTYARLRDQHGHVIGTPPLVQPTGKFFPDPFQLDGESLVRLLRRMMTYAPLSAELPVQLGIVQGEEHGGGGCGGGGCGSSGGGCGSGGCGSGGCADGGCKDGGCSSGHCHSDQAEKALRSGSVERTASGYSLFLRTSDVVDSDVLTATLARGVGTLVLHEGGETIDDEVGAIAEIAAVVCGFGVLLTNGAEVWKKSCGGPRRMQGTELPLRDLALLLAVDMAVHNFKRGDARTHFAVTQREAFDEAEQWVLSNPALVELLRDKPGFVAAGMFSTEPVRGFLGRLFHRRKGADELPSAPAKKTPPMSEEKRRRIEETKALVDDVLRSSEG